MTIVGQHKNRVSVPFIGDDEALARALQSNQPGAREALYDRYATHVRRVLVRTLGTTVDIQDRLHDVFLEVFNSSSGIRDGAKLKGWLSRVTVFTAIAHIRRRSKRRWLVYSAPEEVPEMAVPAMDNEKRQAVRDVYAILEKMPIKERMPFALRVIDGMSLQDVADACDISLATVKRRISKGRLRFETLAGKYPLLQDMLRADVPGRQQ